MFRHLDAHGVGPSDAALPGGHLGEDGDRNLGLGTAADVEADRSAQAGVFGVGDIEFPQPFALHGGLLAQYAITPLLHPTKGVAARATWACYWRACKGDRR